MANPKPVAEVRIGRAKATLWPNETEDRTRHNVTFSRLYKDGEEWKLWRSRHNFHYAGRRIMPSWPDC